MIFPGITLAAKEQLQRDIEKAWAERAAECTPSVWTKERAGFSWQARPAFFSVFWKASLLFSLLLVGCSFEARQGCPTCEEAENAAECAERGGQGLEAGAGPGCFCQPSALDVARELGCQL